jgi:hypothetical protein
VPGRVASIEPSTFTTTTEPAVGDGLCARARMPEHRQGEHHEARAGGTRMGAGHDHPGVS